MRFVTLFTRTENIHLLKDVGLVPYYLHRCFGVDASIATYKNSESYPYLEREVNGLKLEFFPKTKLGKLLDGISYLTKEGKNIDVLNLYHLNLSSFAPLRTPHQSISFTYSAVGILMINSFDCFIIS